MKATVVRSAMAKTGNGKDQLVIVFEANGKQYPYYQFFESDSNLEFAAKALAVLGWNPDDHGWRISELHETNILVGREADIVIETEEYNGRQYERVKYINGAGGGIRNAMSADDVRSFEARLAARRGVTVQPAGINDDDVPF